MIQPFRRPSAAARFLKKAALSLCAFFALNAAAQVDTVVVDTVEINPFSAYFPNMPQMTLKYEKVEKEYKYRVTFTDKKDCGFSTKHPEAFLSEKAIARRKRYGLKVDEHDLPITPAYLDRLRAMGLSLHNQSKWNNTAVVCVKDTALMARVRALPFVREARCVWEGPDSVCVNFGELKSTLLGMMQILEEPDTVLRDYYGVGALQATMLRVDRLHAGDGPTMKPGLRGAGVTIAILDGGFLNADIIPWLRRAKVLGTRNFVNPAESVYRTIEHGMNVLSCIAADVPGTFVGTAPDASFYLLQTEDSDSEQLVEEDNWAAGLEYADSLGCDIVTSSLGYYHFDHEYMNHAYADLDGQTALISRSASLAASRGILLLNSAGNSGDNAWKKIGFPADATDILTVGAVDSERVNTPFSSIGASSDGRVKPDVMALGQDAAVYDIDGATSVADGTSFSCPIMAGAAACLVQRHPTKRPTEIIRALQQSGSNADRHLPTELYGYGIPDLVKANELLSK